MDQSGNTNMAPNGSQPQPQLSPNPPQPAPQPMQQPMSVQAPQPIGSMPSQTPKKSKTGLIIGLVVGGVVLLLLVVVIIVVVLALGISKADYRAALNQANTVASTGNQMSSDMANLSGDPSTITPGSVTAVQNDIKSLNAANTKLSTMKALKDKDVAADWSAYQKQYTPFIAKASNVVHDLGLFAPAAKTCNALQDESDPTVSDVRACAQALTGLQSQLQDSDFKAFDTTAAQAFTQIANDDSQEQALSDPYGNDFDTLQSLQNDAQNAANKVQDAVTTFQNAMNALDTTENNVTNAFTKLLDTLQSKANS